MKKNSSPYTITLISTYCFSSRYMYICYSGNFIKILFIKKKGDVVNLLKIC